MSPPQVKCAVSTTTNLYVSLNFFLDLSIVSSSVALPTRLVYVFDALYFIIQFHHMRVVSQDIFYCERIYLLHLLLKNCLSLVHFLIEYARSQL